MTTSNVDALNVYYKHCNDFGIEPEEGIDELSASEIFVKCAEVYQKGLDMQNVKV